jgi:predicted CoA-binding protein
MTLRTAVSDFLAQKSLALAGASRSGQGFGNVVLKELRSKGYEVILIHPEASEIQGIPCYSSLRQVGEKVGGLVVVVPPEQTEKLVEEAAQAGISRIWMQQGAESPAAVAACEKHGIQAIHGECILMFAEPTAFVHKCHRWVWGLLGKLPK